MSTVFLRHIRLFFLSQEPHMYVFGCLTAEMRSFHWKKAVASQLKRSQRKAVPLCPWLLLWRGVNEEGGEISPHSP